MNGFHSGGEHLQAELARLDLMLRRQALRLRASGLLVENELRGLYLPDGLVDTLLRPREELGEEEDGLQALSHCIEHLRLENEARARLGLTSGIDLPLSRMADLFGLSAFEQETLLIC